LASDGLFGALFVPAPLRAALSDESWLQAMLDAERALAVAEARAGVIPSDAAEAIADACEADRFDPEQIGVESRRVGNPAEPLVRALRDAVGGEAAQYVHWGATSQDVVDTAAALVSRRALELVLADLGAVADACAALADDHRGTLLAGRTLLQQASPTSFGFKAAGWLVGVIEVRRGLTAARAGLPVQLGGAVGTLAALGSDGPAVLAGFADELGLPQPVLPWHTMRLPIAGLGAALDLAAGTLAKIALDVALLAQTEVGEAVESSEGGRGGSSTLPHKRNPIGATLALACARQVHAHAGVLTGSLAQEHERAIGAWHAEWQPLRDALALTGGAANWVRETLEGLEVDAGRMRRNLDATNGLIMAEAAGFRLASKLGRSEANDAVAAAATRVAETGRSLEEELGEPLDPAAYLGMAGEFVDRALAFHRSGA
jgi:3-carboxy-cis,cis-muconate cycloisomerase